MSSIETTNTQSNATTNTTENTPPNTFHQDSSFETEQEEHDTDTIDTTSNTTEPDTMVEQFIHAFTEPFQLFTDEQKTALEDDFASEKECQKIIKVESESPQLGVETTKARVLQGIQ